MKFSPKILISLCLILALICWGIGIWSGSSFSETIQATLFVLVTVFILIVLPGAWLVGRRPWLQNLRWRRPPPFSDSQYGPLRFTFGFDTCFWRGSIGLLPGTSVPLAVAGGANGPDPVALDTAHRLAARFPTWQPAIKKALFSHYEPYAEAVASGELKLSEPLPANLKPDDLWNLVVWDYVAILSIGGRLITEIGLRVPWDEEHILGLLFEADRLVQLNGSVVPP